MESPATFPQVLTSKTTSTGTLETRWMHHNAVQCGAECKCIDSPCYVLTVRIIRMRNLHQADYLSETDCYVTLWLPTASFEKARTKTVSNCRDPVWNETFYFRIQSQVKNVLELTVCDEDVIRDDSYRIIFFDIAKVPLGESVLMKFELNALKHEELEVEFTLEPIQGPPETITSNGAVVCRECCCLEVQGIQKKRKKKKWRSKQQDIKCTLKGSFEDTQNISLRCASSLHFTEPSLFHYTRHKQGELDVVIPRKRSLRSFCACNSGGTGRKKNWALPVNLLPIDQEVIKEEKDFNLHFKAKECAQCPDVRLGFDLCTEEKEFLQKRKKVAAAAFKRVFQLEKDLQGDEMRQEAAELLAVVGKLCLRQRIGFHTPVLQTKGHNSQVPVVAIMTTGGGIRALTALYAHLLTLQRFGVLDCVSYLSGLSGTTWTMSKLYEDPNWSCNDLEVPLADVHKQVRKNKFLASFSPERLKYYAEELRQRYQEGRSVSFTDLWGLILESMLCDGENPHKLTDQQQALIHGQNPLPVYLCLSVKEKLSNHGYREWLEFNPYEIGFQKYGAYIRAEHFGSEFFMGHLMKKIPESRICYLEGIWSSVFSFNLMDAWFMTVSSEDFWQAWTRERVIDIDESPWCTKAYELPTRMQCPPESLASVFQDIIMWRPAVSVIPNFLRGCPMHNKYLESRFSEWKDCDLDSFPNQLTGSEDYLYLVDNAFALDTSYPPLLRPERKVDLFIHLNYSSGSQLAPLQKASDYFSKLGIPFPKNIPTDEHVKECYLIGEEESRETPLVLLFSLVCDTFREYKAPGVKRTPEEMKDGEVDVASDIGPYDIYTLRYPEENYEKLVKLSQYNIQNNKDMLMKALHIALERKRWHNQS